MAQENRDDRGPSPAGATLRRMNTVAVRLSDRPELERCFAEIGRAVWPRFLREGDHGGNPYWPRLFTEFPEYQVALLGDGGDVVAAGNTIPVSVVDGRLPAGWESVLRQGCENREAGRTATTLSAIAATVAPQHQGRGLSTALLGAMKALAVDAGLDAMIAPVRPTLKERYPLTPIDRYAAWTRPDGSPFDPWLRAHWRLGARIVALAPESLTVRGPVADWEEWTGLAFPESGSYVVPGALTPVQIDREHDVGWNVEPNVWMRHPVR
jgi:GNAT superfamily N-acetyltransferase